MRWACAGGILDSKIHFSMLFLGLPVVFHTQNIEEPATITALVSLIDKTTGSVIRNKPRVLTEGSAAIVEIALQRGVSLEVYQDYKTLGRFMLRDQGKTLAAGIVLAIL